jgi:histidine ammonia-lyase
VGASGDLAPLSHLALGLIGMGNMWNPKTNQYEEAASVMAQHQLQPIKLGPKEGLAMINGTQFMSSLGAEAVARCENLIKTADIVGALSLEVLKGTRRAFDPKIHAARPHAGQIASASRLRTLLHQPEDPSTLYESHIQCHRVQDAYSLRCMPQVHGVAFDTTAFVKRVLTTELNSATDNPMIFAETCESISGGNFHGEYPVGDEKNFDMT